MKREQERPSSPRRLSGLAARLAAALVAAAFGVVATAQQGGRAVVSFQVDVSTLDPAIGYDWQNWSIIKSIFDGLMDYEPGSTNLKPTWPRATRSRRTAAPTPSRCARG